jgi:hypothetical protein
MPGRATVLLSLLALTLIGCARVPVEFRDPVPASELPRLERELGVRIVGYQSKHPGIDTTLTIGGGVERGQTLAEALDDTRDATLRWSAHRRAPPGDDATRERARADLEAQIAHFERHGLLIHLIYVDGPLDALRARAHPLVAPSARRDAPLLEREDLESLGLTAHLRVAERTQRHAIAPKVPGGRARQHGVDLVFLRERFHTRSGVDRIADRREV